MSSCNFFDEKNKYYNSNNKCDKCEVGSRFLYSDRHRCISSAVPGKHNRSRTAYSHIKLYLFYDLLLGKFVI